MASSRVWLPTAHCSWTSSSRWVSFHPSRRHWPCPVLPVWCCHSVWRWMRTYLSMNVQKKSFVPARVWRKHWLTVIQMPSLLSSTPTWHLSSPVSSCSTSVQVLSVVLPLHWLSVSLYPSSLLCSWLVWFTNTSWIKTSGWTWHLLPRFPETCW